MIDIKRLAKAWEIFRDSNPYEICDGRQFRAIKEPEYCMGQMIDDTLALLKDFENLQERHDILVDAADRMLAELKERAEVIRCGDCVFYDCGENSGCRLHCVYTGEYGFCSWAIKKNEKSKGEEC